MSVLPHSNLWIEKYCKISHIFHEKNMVLLQITDKRFKESPDTTEYFSMKCLTSSHVTGPHISKLSHTFYIWWRHLNLYNYSYVEFIASTPKNLRYR